MTKASPGKRIWVWVLTAALAVSLAVPLLTPAARAAEEYDTAGAASFVFSDSGITAAEGDYSGCKIDGTALTIQDAGVYSVSGSCADGSIKVKKGVTGVTLILSGLTLTSADTAPITCAKSTGVTIAAAAGTVNTLTDSAKNNDETYPNNENAENAVIKCKDGSQVTICGTGTLKLRANGKNGIKSGATTDTEGEAWLKVSGVTLEIDAGVNDGINAEQLLEITGGTVTVSAADDGIHCDRVLRIGASGTDGPTVTVEKCCEGLEAAELYIVSGTVVIHAEDDCLNAANSDLTGYDFVLDISGGTLVMDTTSGDGIDSNGTLTISGGSVTVWTGNTADNQPLDADGTISITGGTVLAAGGSAGMGIKLSAGQPYVVFGAGAQMGGPGGMGGQNPGTPPDGQNNSGAAGGASSVSVSSGSTISIQNGSGSTVYTGTALTNAGYMFFSSPALTSGESYTLTSAGTELAQAQAGTDSTSTSRPAGGQGGTASSGSASGTTSGTANAPAGNGNGFGDVPSGAYFADAVNWAVKQKITSGTTDHTFSPYQTCTTAQILTFLWRAAGSPEPTSENPFTDVDESAYYCKAALWAAEQGLISGTRLQGGSPCTRAQTVTYLWKLAGSPAADGAAFTDVPAGTDQAQAAAWALSKGVTNGTTAATFAPDNTCTRAQIVTFLYRAMQ
ncbi:carbohydrate-binding domain-containing protein [uncultured Oscillibacter sp.]|uniref:carbohydrate-binding domain-containing protein n=1 Tax=uncultured Oscillibacter sp. TaxID=876091 RepID=UPI0025CD595D|nr:carbohydrate-binding domain-containing protein [uncultured Oscillibacter sp.]